MSDDEQADHALVMPFLPVRSKGGPYDDESFVAGYEMGKLDAELAAYPTNPPERPIHEANRAQSDLIAMRHGYRARFPTPAENGWLWLDVEEAREDEL